jgi:hypothetical protein
VIIPPPGGADIPNHYPETLGDVELNQGSLTPSPPFLAKHERDIHISPYHVMRLTTPKQGDTYGMKVTVDL